MQLEQGKAKDSFKCPRCGSEFNGDSCEKCGYNTPEEYYSDDCFPKNTVSIACYVTGAIFILSYILSALRILPNIEGLRWLFVGFACVMIVIGKGFKMVYTALEAIYHKQK